MQKIHQNAQHQVRPGVIMKIQSPCQCDGGLLKVLEVRPDGHVRAEVLSARLCCPGTALYVGDQHTVRRNELVFAFDYSPVRLESIQKMKYGFEQFSNKWSPLVEQGKIA